MSTRTSTRMSTRARAKGLRARLPRHARTHLCKAQEADDGILLIHPPRPMLPAGPAGVRARVRARVSVGITVAVGLAAMLRVLRHHSTHERPHVTAQDDAAAAQH